MDRLEADNHRFKEKLRDLDYYKKRAEVSLDILFCVQYFESGGLMAIALHSGASGPGSSPGRGHCVVFLGKTPFSHSASLHPGV